MYVCKNVVYMYLIRITLGLFFHNYRVWEELAPMGIARIQPGVATLSGRVYAVGGEQGSQILANGEVYDPQVRFI